MKFPHCIPTIMRLLKSPEGFTLHMGNIPIGFHLLPEKFMMSVLRIIYESIVGNSLDRRNFQKKILSTGFVYKTDEVCKKRGVKTTRLFSFKKEKYEIALKDGFFLLSDAG